MDQWKGAARMKDLLTPQARFLRINESIRFCLQDIHNNIEANRKKIGAALRRVQKDELWKFGFLTWEAYVVDTFKMCRQRAYQLMNLADVSTSVDTEAQARV